MAESMIRLVPKFDGDRDEEALAAVAVLKSPDAELFDKDVACRQVAIYGTKEAVPHLAAIVAGDTNIFGVACWGLECIPDESAGAALRDLLGQVEGERRLKVIQTIANRGDAKAVGALAKMLGSEDRQLVATTAEALGEIGGAEAADALTRALDAAPAGMKKAIGNGCLIVADTLKAQGHADKAKDVLQKVAGADVPPYMREAARQNA
jgi:hypothetical protein